MVSIFFFQNSWEKEFLNDPWNWKHVDNWYTFHSVSAKRSVCTGRGNPAMITRISQLLSKDRRKLSSPHMKGRRIIALILYRSSVLVYFTCTFFCTCVYVTFSKHIIFFKSWKRIAWLSSDTTLTSAATPAFLEEMLSFMSSTKQRQMQF